MKVTHLLLAGALLTPLHILAQEVRASALLGATVFAPGGQNLGYVTDLAIDLGRGEVRYAMVRVDARTSAQQPVYGVPLAALLPGTLRHHLVLDRSALAAQPPVAPDAQLVHASRLIGGEIADLVFDMRSARVSHALVRLRDGGTRAARLEVLEPAVELRGTILERRLVETPHGMREAASLKTADRRILELDLGPPGGEATIAPGEAVVIAAHPGELAGKPVYVVDVILQRFSAAGK